MGCLNVESRHVSGGEMQSRLRIVEKAAEREKPAKIGSFDHFVRSAIGTSSGRSGLD